MGERETEYNNCLLLKTSFPAMSQEPESPPSGRASERGTLHIGLKFPPPFYLPFKR